MSYRKDCNKILKKIDIIAKKGSDGCFEYYNYIDELISNGMYDNLESVMISEYQIDIRRYNTVELMKKSTFGLIRELTNSTFQKKLKLLFDKNDIYPIGYHIYDSNNSQYLGDIQEVEESSNWNFYRDPALSEKQDQIKTINIEVTIGSIPSIKDATTPFIESHDYVIRYEEDNVVIRGEQLYKCIESYTWSSETLITPTYSSYWNPISSPTYSYTLIDSDVTPLIDKYKQAILILKNNI